MEEELKSAGADYRDEEVVVDENLITSREPSDLPSFMGEIKKRQRIGISLSFPCDGKDVFIHNDQKEHRQ